MIEFIMYFGIGFLAAALGALIIMPFVHGRAVRLTTQRLEAATPSSKAEIVADKDLLRAEFAMSMRGLEVKHDQLRTRSTSQLLELGKKNDAINQLKIELGGLRDQLRASEEKAAVKTAAVREAERALFDKQSQLAKLKGELAERANLADARKIEIIALEARNEALKKPLAGAGNELAAVEHGHDAMRIAFEAELAAVRDLLRASEEKVAVKAAAVQEAERAVSDKELELVRMRGELAEQSNLADAQKIEIIALETKVEALNARLEGAGDELKAVKNRRNADRIAFEAELGKVRDRLRASEEAVAVKATSVEAAERALSEKDSQLAKLKEELVECSNFADAQKSEIAALATEVEALKGRLEQAGSELKAAKARHTAEHIALDADLAALRDQLRASEETVAVKAAAAQEAERALSDKESEFAKLMDELAEWSKLADAHKVEIAAIETEAGALKEQLNEAVSQLQAMKNGRDAERSELEYLRGEIEIACKAEADLRNAVIGIEERANTATQNLMAEKAELQAALERADDEVARLARELADMTRQVEEIWAAGRGETANECIKDASADKASRAAFGRLARGAASDSSTLVTGFAYTPVKRAPFRPIT